MIAERAFVVRVLVAILGVASVFAAAPSARPQDAAPTVSFDEFLAGIRTEALERGISAATLDAAFANLTPDPVVISRDRAQPEQVQSLEAYVTRRLSQSTIRTGREMFRRHRGLLSRVEAAYGVPASILVAIWGIESNFGQFTGTYPAIRALATLAYDGRRALFRSELFDALRILDRGDVAAADLKSSWAGAMGQPQFMPSSFLRHAVDFNEDGHIDIWSSADDVFGSMANYLKEAGWTRGERWGREVTLSRAVTARIERTVPLRNSGCRAVRAMTTPKPLADWTTLGVTLVGGRALPASTLEGSLVRGERRAFLVYRNYDAILAYNCSNSYAVAVGMLADQIR